MTAFRTCAALASFAALAACARESAPKRVDTASATPSTTPSTTVSAAMRTSADTSAPAAHPAMEVTPRGIGPLQAGMSLADASAALGGALGAPKGGDPMGCDYVDWRGAPPGVRVMIEEGRIARIDVDSGSVATVAGARVGDTEDRVMSLYPGRVTVTPQKYTAGHYLTVTPASPADSAFRIIFETEHGHVTHFRAGRRPPVEYVEGCG